MNLLKNLVEVFSKLYSWILLIVTSLIVGGVFYYFTNFALIYGNYGMFYYWMHVISQVLITILFSLFIPITFYKFYIFNTVSYKGGILSSVGTFISLIVGGCAACSITLASYLGLASVVTLFPFAGLEIKLISIPILMGVNYVTLRDLYVCKIKKKK